MPLLVMSPGQVNPSWEDFVDSLAANEHQASKYMGLVILSWSLECHTTLNAIPCIFIYIYKANNPQSVTYVRNLFKRVGDVVFGNLLMDVLTGIGSTSLPARTQRPHRRSLRLRRQLRQLLPMLLLVCVQRSQKGHLGRPCRWLAIRGVQTHVEKILSCSLGPWNVSISMDISP